MTCADTAIAERGAANEGAVLRLFLWKDVLHDYTPGMMGALAETAEQARALVLAECDYVSPDDLAKEPAVYDQPKGFFVWGGG